jgi:Ser/Thr protein kinase RdoA (MazF antagonist)
MTALGAECIAETANLWHLPAPTESSALATNNLVWRCGDAWLKASSAGHQRRERAVRILDQLQDLKSLALPRALRTGDGRAIVEYRGLHWTAETALTGTHPNPNRRADYQEAWAATCALHEALLAIKPDVALKSQVVHELRVRLREAPLVGERINQVPMLQATKLLTRELDWIESWVPQVIHGDVSHPNILLSPVGTHGFIDFEFASVDPIEFDFATLITTLMVRSDLDGQTREAILKALVDASGIDQARILLAALARRWLAVAANLTHDDGPDLEILQRQMHHISIFTPLTEKSLKRHARLSPGMAKRLTFASGARPEDVRIP